MGSGSGLSRRELLKRGAAGGAALVFAPTALGCSRANSQAGPRIVIVGAGLAGLSCAYRLQRRGVSSAVYEANRERIGGRCWTARDFAQGQTAEHGGEFIDSRHRRLRTLAKGFGFELDDLYAVPNPGRPRLWLDGELRRRSAMRAQREVFQRRIERAAERVGTYGYADATPAARAFDELSVKEWLDRNVPGGGSASLWGQYVWAEMASEFGLDADRLSALNLFYEYVENTPGADERYHVRGGNDQIPEAMAAALPDGTVHLDTPLEALFERGDGSYGMRFGGVAGEVVADRVVLAIPFTTLRRVDLDGAGLAAESAPASTSSGWGPTPRC